MQFKPVYIVYGLVFVFGWIYQPEVFEFIAKLFT